MPTYQIIKRIAQFLKIIPDSKNTSKAIRETGKDLDIR